MPNNTNGNQQLLDSLMKQLNPDDKKKLDSILSDKSALSKILSTPEAQKLMKELGGK